MRHLSSAIRWGVIIGLANLAWLYLSFYLGLHTSGILIFQGVLVGWFIITVVSVVLALRAIRAAQGRLSVAEGLQAGVVMGAVSAVIAIVMQVGYFTVIHPEWPEYLQGAAREHFTARGASEDEIARQVEATRRRVTMRGYATQSAILALVASTVISAVAMAFLRPRRGAGLSAD